MAKSIFLGMKMAVLLVFLVIPTFAVGDHVETDKSITTTDDSPASAPSTCPELVPGEMVDDVLDHLKLPGFIKSILRKSAKFAACIADNFCRCLKPEFESASIGCLIKIGLKCMKCSIPDGVYDCTNACAKSIVKANHTRLSDEAIGDFCYNKCIKGVN